MAALRAAVFEISANDLRGLFKHPLARRGLCMYIAFLSAVRAKHITDFSNISRPTFVVQQTLNRCKIVHVRHYCVGMSETFFETIPKMSSESIAALLVASGGL